MGSEKPSLAALRRSPVVFARWIGQPFALFQEGAAEVVADVSVRLLALLAGRQMGKSRLLAVMALWLAFRARNQTILLVSASDHAARRLLSLAAAMAHGSELLAGSVVDTQRNVIRLSNGSVIRSLAASESSIRGWSADGLLVDEAALLPAEILTDSALPTTIARERAKVILASSASRAQGPFYDLFRRGEMGSADSRAIRWVSRLVGGDCDADWVSPSAVALDEAAMSPLAFDAEHRARFAGGASALFSPATLDRMFRFDYVPDTLATLYGPPRVALGVDWGGNSDRSVAVALAQIPGAGKRLFAVRAVRRWAAGAPIPDVVGEIAASPGHFQAVMPEVNGLGIAASQYLFAELERRPYSAGGGREQQPHWVAVEERGVNPEDVPVKVRRQRYQGFVSERRPVTTSAQSKAATWSAIRLAVDKGELIAPPCEVDLRRELALLEVSLNQSGGEKIEASVGNDDLCDGLYLACAPYRRHSGEWTCSLADLTDLRRPLPEVQVPAQVLASPQVSDGEISIPRRPAWQSISGPGLTVYNDDGR